VTSSRTQGLAGAPFGAAWAVGTAGVAATGNDNTLVEHRAAHSTDWIAEASPNPNPNGNDQLGGVVVIGQHDVFAVGAHDGPVALKTLIMLRCF
jgi:hypothetical protein